VRVPFYCSRPAFDLDQVEPARRQHHEIDFVDAPLVRDELEVCPGVVGLLVGEALADEVQRVLLPGEGGLGDRVPAGGGRGMRCRTSSQSAQ
jgi:hypothetical protein